jgi:hypothetical protein
MILGEYPIQEVVRFRSVTLEGRKDAYVEYTSFDAQYLYGCEISPGKMGCLVCPRARCKYENGEQLKTQIANAEQKAIIAYGRYTTLHEPIAVLAKEYNVSTRTIHRWIKRGSKQHAV